MMTDHPFDPSSISDPYKEIYKIDTGNVFCDLQQKWKDYDQSFLLSEVQNAYVTTLSYKKIFRPIAMEKKEWEKAVHDLERQYLTESRRIADSDDAFPFTDFFLVKSKGETQVIDYSSACVLDLQDAAFRLFFSLQLTLTDILEVKSFLAFHLQTTFEEDEKAFTQYLADCQKKYSLLFNEIYTQEIKEFINALQESQIELKMGIEGSDDADGKSEYTLNRQVLLMYYLFQKLNVTRATSNLTDMARIIQGLTGRQLNAKDVRNTEIYKRLANPLKDKTKGAFQEDLIFVRNIFEKLGLVDIAEKISAEIRFKE